MRLLAAALTLAILHIQTQSPPDDSVRAAIEEHVAKVSGVTLDFPPDWSVDQYKDDGYNKSVYLGSKSDKMAIVQRPLDPSEELHDSFKWSLSAFDGKGFIAVGELRTTTVDGREVLVQQFKDKAGNRLGGLWVLFSPNTCVEILHLGPKDTVEAREAILKSLHIRPLDVQSPPAQTSRPEILGDFVQGRYSNTVLGVTLKFPTNWEIDNPDEAEQASRSLPRRMHLRFRSSEDLVFLSASPVTPDEKLDWVFAASFAGARDAAGFKTVGQQMTTNIDGCEVLSQAVSMKSKAGNRFGVYRGFFSHGYFVSVLHLGPQSTEETREAIVVNMHIQF